MNRRLLAATALTSTLVMLAPGAASAQVAGDWTGAYIGFGGGAIVVRDTVETSSHGNAALNGNGGVFSYLTGYSWGTPAGFLGVEADINFLGAGTVAGTTSPLPGAQVETKLDHLMTLRARAGFPIGPRAMLFATGGLAIGNAALSTSYTDGGKTTAGTGGGFRYGGVVGAGIEFAVAESVRLRTEAMYYVLAPLTVDAVPGGAVPPYPPAYTATSNPRGFIARVGVTFDLN